LDDQSDVQPFDGVFSREKLICYGGPRLIKFKVCRAGDFQVRVGMAQDGNLQNERVTAQMS
jgi:hypothetical protein